MVATENMTYLFTRAYRSSACPFIHLSCACLPLSDVTGSSRKPSAQTTLNMRLFRLIIHCLFTSPTDR